MISRRPATMRVRLAILIAALVIPFGAISTYQTQANQDRLRAEALEEAAAFAHRVSHSVDDYVRSIDEVLITLTHEDAVRAQDYEATREWFQEVWPGLSSTSNIIYVEPGGQIRAAGRANDDGRRAPNVSETAYYDRAIDSTGLTVGDFMWGKISGTPVVHLSRPVFTEEGEQHGFVSAPIDLTRVYDRIVLEDVPRDVYVTVFDDRGVVIARNVDNMLWIGRDVIGDTQLHEFRSGQTPAEMLSLEGLECLCGTAQCASTGWWVCVGVDCDRVETDVRQANLETFALYGPLLAIAVGMALWAGRDVDRLGQRLAERAMSDPLTNLGNFRKLSEDFPPQIASALRYREHLTVLMLDVDMFKEFNDEHGHMAGDDALACIGHVIRETTREEDLAYRYGGEEFLVLMPHTDREGAALLADRLRKTVARTSCLVSEAGVNINLTVSMGIAVLPEDGTTRTELVANADQALYAAKRSGRNRIVDRAPSLED